MDDYEIVNYDYFSKIKLKVGTILSAEDIPGKDKLYLVKVDVGEDTPRTLLAGIKQYYAKDELINKQIIVIVNLEPRKLAGQFSQGMMLASVETNEAVEKIALLTPDKKMKNGANIM